MADWPPADDYRTAVLNPNLSFSDPELKSGQPSKNTFGLPLVWSGQFASVFRMQNTGGTRAVRCFTSQISDQQERYAKLYQHINGKSLPMLADFEYQIKGVRIRGTWYPIIKMEWVEGIPLDQQVEECINKRDVNKLNSIANQWLHLIKGLQQAQIAHGDLQHENILISNGYIRLVDYDGIFVPSLAGKSALEKGHQHYQHPNRTARDFNLNLDNFPTLVIYLSLKALASDPSLWNRFHTDKHLILLDKDFESPNQSATFVALKRSSSSKVRELAITLENFCRRPLSSATTLDSVLNLPPAALDDWRKSWAGMIPPTPPKAAIVPPPISPPPKSISRPIVPPIISEPVKSRWKFPVLVVLIAIFMMIMRLTAINKSVEESNAFIQKTKVSLENSMRLQKQADSRKKLQEQEEAKKRLLEKNKAEEQDRLVLKEKTAFDQAVQTGTIKALEEFLKYYPQSQYTRQARIQIMDIQSQEEKNSFEYAKKIGTIQAFKNFLKKYPTSRYKGDINRQIQYLQEQEVKKAAQLDKEKRQREAETLQKKPLQQEKEAFDTAKRKGTISALQKFLDRYPNSQYRLEARNLIQDMQKKEQKKDSRDQIKGQPPPF